VLIGTHLPFCLARTGRVDDQLEAAVGLATTCWVSVVIASSRPASGGVSLGHLGLRGLRLHGRFAPGRSDGVALVTGSPDALSVFVVVPAGGGGPRRRRDDRRPDCEADRARDRDQAHSGTHFCHYAWQQTLPPWRRGCRRGTATPVTRAANRTVGWEVTAHSDCSGATRAPAVGRTAAAIRIFYSKIALFELFGLWA